MKVLFLDIDGVLNTDYDRSVMPVCAFHKNIFDGIPLSIDGMNFKPSCVEAFRRIINEVPELHLVISSNWRLHVKAKHFYELFKLYGIEPFHIDLIDQDEEDSFFKRSFLLCKYIKFNTAKTVKYVAVDDRKDLFHSEFSNVYFTDPGCGLTDNDATVIIEFLNKDIKQPIKSLCSDRCPDCNSLLYAKPRGGIGCTNCSYWFCY